MRARTAEAAVRLVAARLRVARGGFGHWRDRLGLAGQAAGDQLAEAHRLARHVDRAAGRLPIKLLCLPRAMALSAMLRRRALPHEVVIAARPRGARGGEDDLHAWVECGGETVLGALPGPWAELQRLAG